MGVQPETDVGRSVVFEHAGRHIRLDAERGKEAGKKLSAEAEVEMLLFVAQGHHVAQFRIGEYALVTDDIVFVGQICGKRREAHVEADVAQVIESHRLVGQPRVAQGAVNRMFLIQDFKGRGVERAGIDNPRGIQENAVEMKVREGDKGGVDRL